MLLAGGGAVAAEIPLNRFFATLVALVLVLVSALALSGPGRHRHHSIAGGPVQLRNKLTNIREKKAAVKAKLRATKQKVHYVRQDLQNIEGKLNDMTDQLSNTADRLVASEKEQNVVAAELKAANSQLEATRAQVRVRLRNIYMESQSSDFSAVAGTRQAGDVASTGYLMGRIERKDRELFDRFKRLQQQVTDRKRRQDELVVQVKRLVDSERAETVQLDSTREQKKEVLADLSKEQGELQEMLDQIDRDEENITSEIEEYIRRMAANRPKTAGPPLPAFSGRFSRPVDAPITSGFGYRFHPILHIRRLHAGVDFGASYGTPIHAAADGVVMATQVMRGYGRVVIIDHGGGVSTVYAHTSRFYCSAGEHVKRGQVIAAVGATGLATGPHLHFEVRINGRPVDPMSRL